MNKGNRTHFDSVHYIYGFNPRPMKSTSLVSVFLLLFAFGASAAINPPKRKNVLIILTDGQRYNTIRALGNKDIFTPAMDKLVQAGTVFTNVYNAGSSTDKPGITGRTMLMTGKSVFNTVSGGDNIPVTVKTYPQAFREAGYHTFATGRWHGDKASFNRSFESGENIFFGTTHTSHFTPELHHYDSSGLYREPFIGQKFSSGYFADAAVAYLKNYRNTKPFLMYVAFTSPQGPHTPPQDYGFRYDPAHLSIPPGFDVTDAAGNRLNEAEIRKDVANYYAMVSEVDHQINRIIEALKASGHYENTIIVLAGDNGMVVGENGTLGETLLTEYNYHVPVVIAGPGIPAGRKSPNYCYLHDLFPTLCALTGVKPLLNTEGRSQAPAFAKIPFKGRLHLFGASGAYQRSLIKDGYKLVVTNSASGTQTVLYDLKNDPWEQNNLADKTVHAKRVALLRRTLEAEMVAQRDFCNLKKKDWGVVLTAEK